MPKYSIVPKGALPEKFSQFDASVLRDSNNEGMNVWERIEKNSFGYTPCFVFRTLAELPKDTVPYTRKFGEFYVYDLPNLDKKQLGVFKKFLVELFPTAELVDFKPADTFKYDGEFVETAVPIAEEFVRDLCIYFERKSEMLKEITEGSYCTADDINCFEEIRMFVSLKKVLSVLDKKPKRYFEDIDQVIDIAPNSFGDSLVYVYTELGRNLEETKKFFRDQFKIKFVLGKENEVIESLPDNSYIIREYGSIISQGNAYYSEGKQLTDFIIKVKYCVNLPDGGKKFIVSLIGQNGTADDVEFPTVFNKTRFKERVAHFGSFHFYGGDEHLTTIHKAISTCAVPFISPLIGYGFHDFIFAGDNYVWDMRSDSFFERRGDFYFSDEKKRGYVIQDEKGHMLYKNMSAIPSVMPEHPSYTTEEYFNYFGNMYHDGFGRLVFFYLLGMIYAGRFRHNNKFMFPYLMFNGVKGSGKTAISDIMKRVYNYADTKAAQTPYDIFPFPLIYQCTYRKGIPIFLTEFLESGGGAFEQKAKILVSMYDRSTMPKGTATQDILSYPLSALAVVDGEELPKRSALRSRSIICSIVARNNKMKLAEYVDHISQRIPESLFVDALRKDDITMDRYEGYVREGIKILGDIHNDAQERMIGGYAAVYAGAMMFDPSLQDEVVAALVEKIDIAKNVEKESDGVGEILEYIKRYARQLEYVTAFNYDVITKEFIICLSELEAFIEKNHHKLSLSMDAIMKYFPLVEDREVNGGLKTCAIYNLGKNADAFPRQLLFYPQAYRDYQDFISNKK